jgi:hypothetical protein
MYLYMDNLDGDYYALTSTFGAHIFVNNKSATPNMFDGFDCPVNTECNVALIRSFTYREPNPFSDCITDLASYGSIFTNFFAQRTNRSYSRSSCFEYCYNRKLTDKCNCYYNSYPELTYGKQACLTFEQFRCHIELFKEFYKKEAESNCSQECPNYCESNTLSYTINQAKFPSKNFNAILLLRENLLCMKLFAKSCDLIKSQMDSNVLTLEDIEAKMENKVLAINIYYEDLSYTVIEETPKTKVFDVISAVGGNLGLFIGISFLSNFLFNTRFYFKDFILIF